MTTPILIKGLPGTMTATTTIIGTGSTHVTDRIFRVGLTTDLLRGSLISHLLVLEASASWQGLSLFWRMPTHSLGR